MKTLILLFALVAITLALSPDCPSYSQVTTCTPRCKDNGDCVSLGGKCCPNLCNNKSCVTKGNTNKAGAGDNKYSSNGGAGAYCGNVKCNSFEKCGTDPQSKKPKCVRA